MTAAIFLDRDGVLNEDTMYPHKEEQYQLLPGVLEGLSKLKEHYIFVIITNQSGIGRGIFGEDDFHSFNELLLNDLNTAGIEIQKIYHCPHTPDDVCDCRKPSTKFVRDAAEEFSIDLSKSWMLGDHPHDIQMGLDAGVKSIYLLTGHGNKHLPVLDEKNITPTATAATFLEAVQVIEDHEK